MHFTPPRPDDGRARPPRPARQGVRRVPGAALEGHQHRDVHLTPRGPEVPERAGLRHRHGQRVPRLLLRPGAAFDLDHPGPVPGQGEHVHVRERPLVGPGHAFHVGGLDQGRAQLRVRHPGPAGEVRQQRARRQGERAFRPGRARHQQGRAAHHGRAQGPRSEREPVVPGRPLHELHAVQALNDPGEQGCVPRLQLARRGGREHQPRPVPRLPQQALHGVLPPGPAAHRPEPEARDMMSGIHESLPHRPLRHEGVQVGVVPVPESQQGRQGKRHARMMPGAGPPEGHR